MLQWKEFSAWITIDGKVAPEFDVKTLEDEKEVACWIPSKLGKTFELHWKNSFYRHNTMGNIKVDGSECGGMIIHTPFDFPETVSYGGISDGRNCEPFVFSALELTGSISSFTP
ncbi:hypothetical protein FB451DRAFT_407873 [Mycena latifolia]|nr:hypothetical protein FB451DRAFT_407873 [Mycena latifolia]